jgi:hypothetical protein
MEKLPSSRSPSTALVKLPQNASTLATLSRDRSPGCWVREAQGSVGAEDPGVSQASHSASSARSSGSTPSAGGMVGAGPVVTAAMAAAWATTSSYRSKFTPSGAPWRDEPLWFSVWHPRQRVVMKGCPKVSHVTRLSGGQVSTTVSGGARPELGGAKGPPPSHDTCAQDARRGSVIASSRGPHPTSLPIKDLPLLGLAS